MRILVIESDMPGARHLQKLLRELAPEKKIVEHCRTVKEAEKWLGTHPAPDLIFSAVQLSDGISLGILKKLNNKTPVIFTCTNEKYAIESFRVNGIDYLLKPVKKEHLQEALKRYENNFASRQNVAQTTSKNVIANPAYQQRFVVNMGKQMKLLQAAEIAYFFTESRIVYIVTSAGDKFVTDYTLEQLSQLLDPKMFFRINRQFIINISSIVKMAPASKSRFELTLKPESRYQTITSNERTADFRKWLTGVL